MSTNRLEQRRRAQIAGGSSDDVCEIVGFVVTGQLDPPALNSKLQNSLSSKTRLCVQSICC